MVGGGRQSVETIVPKNSIVPIDVVDRAKSNKGKVVVGIGSGQNITQYAPSNGMCFE